MISERLLIAIGSWLIGTVCGWLVASRVGPHSTTPALVTCFCAASAIATTAPPMVVEPKQ